MKKTQIPLKARSHRHRATVGFTLIEVMVVLFILLSIAAVGVGSYRAQMESSRIKTTDAYVNSTLATAIKSFELSVGRLPSELNDLMVCPDGVSEQKWGAPYLEDRAATEDPWGSSYQYITPGNRSNSGFDVWSYGPDGMDGTNDDIGNWKRAE